MPFSLLQLADHPFILHFLILTGMQMDRCHSRKTWSIASATSEAVIFHCFWGSDLSIFSPIHFSLKDWTKKLIWLVTQSLPFKMHNVLVVTIKWEWLWRPVPVKVLRKQIALTNNSRSNCVMAIFEGDSYSWTFSRNRAAVCWTYCITLYDAMLSYDALTWELE